MKRWRGKKRRRRGGERGIRKFLEAGDRLFEELGDRNTIHDNLGNSGVGEPRIISSGNEVIRSFDTRTRNTEHFGFQLLLSVTRLSPKSGSGSGSGGAHISNFISADSLFSTREGLSPPLLSPPLFPVANFKSFITAASIKSSVHASGFETRFAIYILAIYVQRYDFWEKRYFRISRCVSPHGGRPSYQYCSKLEISLVIGKQKKSIA